jgi:hypothetical protein
MAKKRTMNELRQEKNYGYKPPLTHNQKSAEARVKGYTEIDIDTTKELIVNNLSNEMYDIIFQAVNDEMVKHEVFQAETYLTPQGFEEFEETWYVFYHDHFGEIMSDIFKSFTN